MPRDDRCHFVGICDAGHVAVDAGDDAMVDLGEWNSPGVAHEYALVVLAMGLGCGVFFDDGRYVIRADACDAEVILAEWRAYDEESRAVDERPPLGSSGFPVRWDLGMAWVLTLMIVYHAQLRNDAVSERYCNSSHGLMLDGEFWRPFTALFLHGDGAHLMGNVLIGGLFLLFVSSVLGSVRGWLLVLGCGALANAANAALRMPEAFFSLGASTATFGALGVLVGHATREAWILRSFQGFRMLFVPLIGGGILLGWFGSGGENPEGVDVAAHVLGWGFGVIAGLVFHRPDPSVEVHRH